MKCVLCGLEFSEAEARRPCKSCPVGQACDLVCCPNCGYQTPGEPRWLRSWRRRWPSPAEGTLAAVKSGAMTEIIGMRSCDETVLRKLAALGLLPGSRVRLLRRFPCYLVELGHMQIALDRELASVIVVRSREK